MASNNPLVHVGFGNYVNSTYILAISSFVRSAPINRAVQTARGNSLLIDLTFGKKTKSAIFMDNNMIAISAIGPEALAMRIKELK